MDLRFYPQVNGCLESAEYVKVGRVRYRVPSEKKKIKVWEEYCLLELEEAVVREKYISLGVNYNLP